MIGSEDGRSGFSRDFTVTASSATGIENSLALQFRQPEAGLGFECGAVFVVVCNFVAVPLKTEAREMLLFDETRNSVNDRMAGRALAARDRFGRQHQRRRTRRTDHVVRDTVQRAVSVD